MTKATELRELNDDELEHAPRRGRRRSCSTCASRHATGQLDNTRPARRASGGTIARMHTLLREREIAAARGEAEDSVMADEPTTNERAEPPQGP